MIQTILTFVGFIVGVVLFVVLLTGLTVGESLGILVVAAFLLLVCKLIAWSAPPKGDS